METRRGNFPKWRIWLGLWLISVGARITEIGDVVFDGKRPMKQVTEFRPTGSWKVTEVGLTDNWKVRPDDRR